MHDKDRRPADALMDYWEGIFTDAYHKLHEDPVGGYNVERTDTSIHFYTGGGDSEGTMVAIHLPSREVRSPNGQFQYTVDDTKHLLVERIKTLIA